jgi:hypothetical protein
LLDQLSYKLLAGAGLAGDEDVTIGGADFFDVSFDLLHRRAVTHQVCAVGAAFDGRSTGH